MSPKVVRAIEIDRDRCDQCGLCVDFCPLQVFAMESGIPEVKNLKACYACETCRDLCPKEAIQIILIDQ